VSARRHNGVIAAGLVFAVLLWGGNNAGVKFLVQSWPPIFVGGTRFLCAGLLMLAVLRWTDWLGRRVLLSTDLKRQLWWRGGLGLAVYIVAFNWAVQLTAVSRVALCLGAAPVWALLWEGRAGASRSNLLKRYGAAGLALLGVGVLFWPALRSGQGSFAGDLLGVACSVLWTSYGRQCRVLGAHLSGAVLTAHTMWRAGALLLPLGLLEVGTRGVPWNSRLLLVQLYCIIAGAVVAFALWNNALRHWKASEVYLFNNLIPLSTMLWAHFTLGEPMTSTFWIAMGLIVSGVLIAQTNWRAVLGWRWLPAE
jgi:drug/metabolite transporter (DMT)-like permease